MIARRLNWSALLAVSLFAYLAPSRAEAQSITITSAEADLAAGQLIVRGSTFPAGGRVFLLQTPVVELPVISLTATELHATLPAPIQAGTVLLLVYHQATGRYGLFSLTMRAALSESVLVDSNGKTIGNLQSETPIAGLATSQFPSGGSVVTLKVSDRRIRVRVAPGGFRSAMVYYSDKFYRGEVAHRDAACSSPQVLDTEDPFLDQAVMTLADGSRVIEPPYGTIAWVPDYTQPYWVCGLGPTYMRLPDGTCVATQPNLCGVPYRPAIPIDLSGFVAPFTVQ